MHEATFMTDTEEAALPIDPQGKLYQQRAARALPLLVRQAMARQTIYYADLADEMGMPNARNLNFVLGSIGSSLDHLRAEWGEKIPPLQAIVVNQSDKMPGSGFIHAVVDPRVLANSSTRTRRQVVKEMLAEVYTYPKWDRVLAHFGIASAPPPVPTDLLERAARGGAGGESSDHAEFKRFVCANPGTAGVTARALKAEVEFSLPTGDRIDVLFSTRNGWVAAEVKSARSDEPDLIRGVFQVVKYMALLEALAASKAMAMDVSACLVLEGPSTNQVQQLANVLGIRVFANARPAVSSVD